MAKIHVFDKPMCCSTGICGPDVDPILPRFAADLEWLKSQGHEVERYNLAQQPQAFISNKSIHDLLSKTGTDSLPAILIDDKIVSCQAYPTRDEFDTLLKGRTAKPTLPLAKPSGGCCGSTGCC